MRDHTFVWEGVLKGEWNEQGAEGNTHVGSKNK